MSSMRERIESPTPERPEDWEPPGVVCQQCGKWHPLASVDALNECDECQGVLATGWRRENGAPYPMDWKAYYVWGNP